MPEYVKVARLAVPVGWRVIVVSDLFLGAKRTETSGSASVELARALERAEGPGAVVVAGNAFDLLVPPGGNPASALGAHRELGQALTSYLAADSGRRAILLPGNRDRAILYDPAAIAAVIAAGFEVALTVELQVATAAGPNRSASNPAGDSTSATPSSTRPTRVTRRSATTPWRRSCLAGRIKLALARGHRPADRSFGLPVSWPHVSPTAAWSDGSGALGSHRGGTVVAAPDYWLFGVPRKLEPFSSRLLGLGLTLVVEVIVADWCWCSSITGSGIRRAVAARPISPPCQRQGPRSVPSDPRWRRCRPCDRPHAPT